MSSNTASVNHGLVFGGLVGLTLISVATTFICLPAAAHNAIIFTIAFLMAGLVVVRYMGLRWQKTLIFWIFVIPVVLFAILVVTLIPDIVLPAFPLSKGF